MSTKSVGKPWRPEAHLDMPRYRIIHDTEYDYGATVSLSRQQLHLTPRSLPYQNCLDHTLTIEPSPNLELARTDSFGNPVTLLAFETRHTRLRVEARSTVDVFEHAPDPVTETPPWEEVRERFVYDAAGPRGVATLDAARFCFESPYGRIKREFADYAAASFQPGIPLLDVIRNLSAQIHHDMQFAPGATTVGTPVMDVLEQRRGVCQDFAHLMISCLRSMGLAVRYVSGYILTTPPPGRPRLVGADASHAWVSVWCPAAGGGVWIDVDPTNDLLPNTQHVTLAWGRDFSDVSPLRGVILGGSAQEPEVRVTMLPLDELALGAPILV
jgi:transglutaminase-like putative cysteine protease